MTTTEEEEPDRPEPADEPSEPGPPAPSEPVRGRWSPRHRARRRRWPVWVIDATLIAALVTGVFFVHDIPYMFRHPFWLDEAWVADSTRARIGLVPWLTSSTPLGFSLLLRLVPGDGLQRLRAVPLAFIILATVTAYLVGRELRIVRYAAGLLPGVAVLLLPAMLIRADLKQYTAEAFTSLVLMLLVVALENRWSLWRLGAIAGFTAAGLLIANSIVFVGVAAMVGLAVETAVTRAWRRLLAVGIAFVAMIGASGAVYVLVDRRHVIPGLTAYWDAYYVPRHQGVGAAWSFIRLRTIELTPFVGLHSTTAALLIVGAGLVTLVLLRRYAVAVMLPVTIVLVIAASIDRRYPFGDERTSTFWLVMAAVVMAVGALGVVRLATKLFAPVGVVAALAAVAVAIPAAHPYLRSRLLADEDVRSQVAYLNAHRRPTDIVILNYGATYAFAYYERQLAPTWQHITFSGTGFFPTYPNVAWLVPMTNRNPTDVTAALATAMARLKAEPIAPGSGRIWILRSHLERTEINAWAAFFRGKHVVNFIVGSEPLVQYTPTAAALAAIRGA